MIALSKPVNFDDTLRVVGVFVESEGRLLLLHRHADRPQGNTWGIPAGKCHAEEELPQAAVRELAEETGIIVAPEALRYQRQIYVRYPDLEFVFHMFRLPLSRDAIPRIVLSPQEHVAFRWLTLTEVLRMPLIPDGDISFVLTYGTPRE